MDSDEEDYVFYGTPIEREEELTSRKKKAVAEASGQLRTLPPWKQEVRDEEGRRRFHGAFTGGFSAGYYNTVGSKEGWTPLSFMSTRKNRAQIKQQSILNFLDDDEKAELEGHSLGTSIQFDTFGFTAAELARKQAEKEQQQRPSIIPGPAPDELVVPANDSIGVKLLVKMGWRHGQAIRDSLSNSLYDARREAREAFLALSSESTAAQLASSDSVRGQPENVTDMSSDNDDHYPQSTPVYVLHPKQDQFGLGYDPYKSAPEFRDMKRSHLSGIKELGHKKTFSAKHSLLTSRLDRIAPGFGIGVLEELDAEDEDVYASGYNFEATYVQEVEEPSAQPRLEYNKGSGKETGVLPGFKIASNSDFKLERFYPPVVPKDFVLHHAFPAPLDVSNKFTDVPPPEIPPPEDNNLKRLIEGVATLVARCGKLFEDLSREKNQSNPSFAFLSGGNGYDYYSRKLWEERQKRNDQNKQQLLLKTVPSAQKMTAESRGKVLGEKPLESSSKDTSSAIPSADIHLHFHLSDTFTKPASLNELSDISKPFRDDPAKQERFEQFLKDKYEGGLRTKDSGGSSNMSEAARARERLEFETAAEAMKKVKWGKESKPFSPQFAASLAAEQLQFTSGGQEQTKVGKAEEVVLKKLYPRREEFQWRPSPILCKRFDLIDPYMGKPPPAPQVRSKMDSLIFMPDSVEAAQIEETTVARNDFFNVGQSVIEEVRKQEADADDDVDVQSDKVERPVDLYKAIFSDDSDNEEENASLNQVEDTGKKMEVASTTLNRLIAGDFLESLGKELGLEVPPDMPYSEFKSRTPASQRMKQKADKGNADSPVENRLASILTAVDRAPVAQNARGQPYEGEGVAVVGTCMFVDANSLGDGNDVSDTVFSQNETSKVELGKVGQEDGKSKCRNWSSGSSEDGRSRKHSRRRRHKSRDSDSQKTDSSDDYRHRSRSKRRKEESSLGKSSSRRLSKHHEHRRGDSPGRSSRHTAERGHRQGKREKRR